jgi:hypothetical protein
MRFIDRTCDEVLRAFGLGMIIGMSATDTLHAIYLLLVLVSYVESL